MATKKTQNIYEKIMAARLQFLEANIQKSGRNDFQKFSYYELDDIVPTATRICTDLGLYTEIDMGAAFFGHATLTVINVENPEERTYFRIKMPELNNDNINKALQETGSCQTYLRRYLYLQFLDIAQEDEIDNKDLRQAKNTTSPKKPASKPRSKPAPRTKQPLTTNKKLTLQQKKQIREIDERLVPVVNSNMYTTMKQMFEKLQDMQENGELTPEERESIAKKISTIE